MGAITTSKTRRPIYYILVEMFNFKDTKKLFEQETGIHLEYFKSEHPLGLEEGAAVVDFFRGALFGRGALSPKNPRPSWQIRYIFAH